MISNGEYPVIDTSLAAYLVHQGFILIEIRYTESDRYNQRKQGTCYFQSSPELIKQVSIYNQGKAIINLAPYELAKKNLMDRIMRGLP